MPRTIKSRLQNMTSPLHSTKITIAPSHNRLRRRYRLRIRVAIAAATSWIWAVLLLGVALLFAPPLPVTVILASTALGVIAIAMVISWRNEVARWHPSQACNLETSCGRSECESPDTGCAERIEREIEKRVLEMELQRLRSLLRKPYGGDIWFFSFWVLFATAIALQRAAVAAMVAGIFLAIASAFVIAARLWLTKLIF